MVDLFGIHIFMLDHVLFLQNKRRIQKLDFNILCYEFQEKIINVFNEEQNIPFLLKYYLFKEIWETLKEEKNNLDVEARMAKTQKTETITKQVKLPQNFFDQNKEKNDSNKDKEDLTN